MRTIRVFSMGLGLLLAAVTCSLVSAKPAAAQGIYVGPGGISLGTGAGSYYIPFNNGRGYSRGYYGPGTYYAPGGYYGTRGYFGRSYGRSGIYWAPGMYWTPNDYWYGDRDWARHDSGVYGNGKAAGLLPRADGQASLPPMPQLEELQRMTWTHLRRVLAYGATQLEQGLARVATGQKWTEYLRVDRLQTLMESQSNVPPTREEVDELVAMLERYNQTAEDERYTSISQQWGFGTVQRALAEFLENPAVRYRRQLVLNSTDLDRALDRFGTGAGWQQHLSLPADLFVDPDDLEAAKSPPDPEALRTALGKYDEVAKNPAYRVIADLPAFQATHASLARYLGRQEPADTDRAATEAAPDEPTLNEPAPVEVTPQADPFQAEPGEDAAGKTPPSKQPVTKPKANSVLKPAPQEAEELIPPPSDTPPQGGPAVREKE